MAWLGLRSEQVAVHGAEDLFLLPACQRIHIKNAIWKMSRDREQEAKSKRQFWGFFCLSIMAFCFVIRWMSLNYLHGPLTSFLGEPLSQSQLSTNIENWLPTSSFKCRWNHHTAGQTAFQGQRCTPTCCCCLCQSRCLHDNRPNYCWNNSNGFLFYSFSAGKLCKVSVLICTPYSELCSYSMTSSSTNTFSLSHKTLPL